MPRAQARQLGFTLVEMGVSLTVMLVMMALLNPVIRHIRDDYRRQIVIEDMLGILAKGSEYRNSISSSTQGANGVWTYTWKATNNGNNFITVASFNSLAGTNLPTINPFGDPYHVRATNEPAQVQTDVPAATFDYGPMEVTNPGGGKSRLTITEHRKPRTQFLHVDTLKHFYYRETRR